MLISNNSVVTQNGLLPVAENKTILEFDVRGTHFPIRGGGPPIEGDNETFGFSVHTPKTGDVMYLDLQDGSGVKTLDLDAYRQTVGGNSVFRLGEFRFADVPESEPYRWNFGAVRKIKIWFSNPSAIRTIRFYYMHLHGEFPKEIANYNLDILILSSTTYLEVFPNSLQGGVFKNLTLANVGPAFEDYVPYWTLKSYINTLNFQSSLDLSRNPKETGYSELHTIGGLRSLDLSGCKLTNESIDDSLKKAPALNHLSVSENRFKTFPQELANIKLTSRFGISIATGYTITGGYPPDMSAWFNCNVIAIDKMLGGVFTTDLFPEFEKFNFNELFFIRTYLTHERLDALLGNIFRYVAEYGEISDANPKAKFRGKSLRLFYPPFPLNSDIRPNGLYIEPRGYVQGVSNGTPTTSMELLWVLVHQYHWTIRLRSDNNEGVGLEVLAP